MGLDNICGRNTSDLEEMIDGERKIYDRIVNAIINRRGVHISDMREYK